LIRATIFSPANTWKMLLLAGAFLLLNHKYLAKLVKVWYTEPDWSHGFIIPLFCLYFLASNYQKLLKVKVKPAYSGLLIVLMGLAMQALAFWLRNSYGVYLGMIGLLFGMVLWLGGWQVIKIVWVPILFLIFAVNVPEMVYRNVAYELQQFAARASVVVLQVLGVQADMAGELGQAETVINLWGPGGDMHQLNVEEACSGMRLLMAFGALAVAISYLSDRPTWERIVLIVSALPVAILCNLLRVVITGILYYLGYPEHAQGLFHTFTGLLMLIPAGLIYLGLAKLMDMLVIKEYSQVQASRQNQADALKPSQSPQGCGDSGSKTVQSAAVLPEQKEQAGPRPGSGGTWRQIIGDKHFLACLVIVLLSAGVLQGSIKALKIHLLKRPAELRAPLASLPGKLGSFEALEIENPDTGQMQIDRVLPEDFIHALETDIYLDRIYRDSQTVEGLTPLVSVFSTYYTGKPDLVPHVPERCQAAAGYTPTGSETFEVDIPGLGLPGDKLTVRASSFAGTDTRTG
ncbi:MAG: exosortase/archaeosortase family protein, partial [Phycisphaerae bacterium]|nr:exosortase/archaeosortase family protein [Phycisphaerae bacterium]